VAGARTFGALARAKEAIAAVSDDTALVTILEQASASDKSDIGPGVRPDQLGQIELWSGRDPPEYIGQLWEALKESLQFANEGWDVWIDWYESRLDGRMRPQEVELAYVNYIRNVSPSAMVAVANSEIRRLIESSSQPAAITGSLAATEAPDSMSIGVTVSARPSVVSGKPNNFYPSIEVIPQQEAGGTRFRADDQGRIDVLRIAAAADELQDLHYREMRFKAQALAALGQMLGDLGYGIGRILEALPEHIDDVSVDQLWSRGNTLRRRYDAHVRTVDDRLGPDPARLHALVAAGLGDLVDSFNVFAIGDPRLLELDRVRLGPQNREAADRIVVLATPIVIAAGESESPATSAAQEALAEQVDAAVDAPSSIDGDQATELVFCL
jgi:hypothetical protein